MFYRFLLAARELGQDFDVMIEAKNKDLSLFNLMSELRGMKGIKVVEEAALNL